MSKKTLGIVFIILGVLLVIVSLAADALGIGGIKFIQESFCNIVYAGEIGVDHLVEIVVSHFGETLIARDAGIVD